MEIIFYLIAIFIVKHLVVDFFWQPEAIAYGKKDSLAILSIHGLMHWGATTFLLLLFNLFWFNISPALLLWVPIIEAGSHWIIDFFTSRIPKWKGWTVKNREFVNNFGVDQALHHLMILVVIYLLV